MTSWLRHRNSVSGWIPEMILSIQFPRQAIKEFGAWRYILVTSVLGDSHNQGIT